MSDTIFDPRSPDGDPPAGGDCITILARDAAGAMAEFSRLGLSAQGFAIAGRVLRHRFAFAGDMPGAPAPFGGEPLFAATYVRAPSA